MSSRAPFRTFGLVIGLAIALGVTAAQAEARTFYPNCTGKLQYKPRSITVFCADAGMIVSRISWSSWGEREARGRSSRASVNECDPNCAQGKTQRFTVGLRLWRARTCPTGRKRVFTRLTVTFIGAKWSGPRRFTQRSPCPDPG
jgi:hypothetical protein